MSIRLLTKPGVVIKAGKKKTPPGFSSQNFLEPMCILYIIKVMMMIFSNQLSSFCFFEWFPPLPAHAVVAEVGFHSKI